MAHSHTLKRRALIAALVGVALARPAAAAESRLFFTAAERAALDAAREKNLKPKAGVTTPLRANPDVGFQGYVSRSDGRATLWVNGEPVDPRGAARRYGAAADLAAGRLKAGGGSIKPGQTLPGAGGKAMETWSAPATRKPVMGDE